MCSYTAFTPLEVNRAQKGSFILIFTQNPSCSYGNADKPLAGKVVVMQTTTCQSGRVYYCLERWTQEPQPVVMMAPSWGTQPLEAISCQLSLRQQLLPTLEGEV